MFPSSQPNSIILTNRPDLEVEISKLPNVAAIPGERQDAIAHVLSGISRLSNQVADAADFAPAYDQRNYAAVIKALTDKVNEEAAKITPKTRFQFKQRAGDSAASAKPDTRRLNPAAANNGNTAPTPEASSSSSSQPGDDKDKGKGNDKGKDNDKDNDKVKDKANDKDKVIVGSLSTVANPATDVAAKDYNAEIARGTGVRQPSFSAARDITLMDHAGVHIHLPSSASRATSAGTLINLDRCVVDMSVPTSDGGAPFASLTLKEITGSVIIAGHVDGPVHITDLRNCVVMVVARQVRIHDCKNVDFYIHCVSRPIIEGCLYVRFSKTPVSYVSSLGSICDFGRMIWWLTNLLLQLTDKDKGEPNLYDHVDDFKWLKKTSSPNWSVLPETMAISDEVWKHALAGGPGLRVLDTLRALGAGSRI